MRFAIAAVLTCTWMACGRIGFEPGGPGGSGFDDGGSSGSSDADVLGTGIDGATDRPNRVFVTSTTTTGALGGIAGADAICAAAAANAGLPGTFVPLLSSLTTDAQQRLSGSRGWIRTGDGAPVADHIDDFFAGMIFNAIDRDEAGNKVIATMYAWTGATTIGGSVENCSEWTGTNNWGRHGQIGGAMSEAVSPLSVYTFSCGSAAALYCFEIGYAVPVQPTATTGARIAFLATPATHGTGLATLDSQCQAEASSATLSGSYVAAVAQQGASIASRFPAGGGWARPDGTQIAATSTAMFDGSEPMSFINQYADGTYAVARNVVRTGGDPNANGTNASTCNDWMSMSGSNMVLGYKSARANAMWSLSQGSCSVVAHTICLQQ